VGANLLLMDERKGSKEARKRGLKTAGTLAILEQADFAGLVDFEGVVVKLGLTSFHLPPVIVKAMISTVRERKRQA
jgi:predicted nucleic acid-binding protein